jgi:hypothetical protein
LSQSLYLALLLIHQGKLLLQSMHFRQRSLQSHEKIWMETRE